MGNWKYHMDILGSSANTGLTDIPSRSEDTNLSSSSVLAWRISGTAEPGGLPSMGSHRVGHYWSNLAAAAAWGSWVEDCSRKWSFLSTPGLSQVILERTLGQRDADTGSWKSAGPHWKWWCPGIWCAKNNLLIIPPLARWCLPVPFPRSCAQCLTDLQASLHYIKNSSH